MNFKDISIARLVIVLFITFVLPLPNFFLNHEYEIQVVPNSAGQPEHAQIDIQDTNLSSASLLTRLVGEEIDSPDLSVCLKNDSNPNPLGFPVATSTKYTGIGGMSVKIIDVKNATDTEIYAPLKTTTCKNFPQGGIQITNKIDVNAMVGPAMIDGQVVRAQFVDMASSTIKVAIIFNPTKYVRDCLVFLLGFGILIHISSVIKDFIRKKR